MNRASMAVAARGAVWIGAWCVAAALGAALAVPAAFADGADYHTQDAQGAQTSPASTASASASSTETYSTETGPADADLEARLAKAREQLEQAARQVASLSAQLGLSASRVMIRRGFRGGVIGLQLDPASGASGARVLEVSPGGPAADGGVRPGDVIVAVNGAPISGEDAAQQVVEHMSRIAPNSKVQLRVMRGGRVRELELTTRPAFVFAFASAPDGAAPAMPAMPATPAVPALPAMPQVSGPVVAVPPFSSMPYFQALSAETAGMELVALTPTLGKYFGTEDGVLVIRSPSHDAFGLQDGDVILAIDGRKPLNGAHATRILGSYQPGERITLRIMRQRKPMSLAITLPQPTPPQPTPPQPTPR